MTDWVSSTALAVSIVAAAATSATTLVLWSQLRVAREQRAAESARVRALEGAVDRLTGVVVVLGQQLVALQARNQIAAAALSLQLQQLEAKKAEVKWSKIGTIFRVGSWLSRHVFGDSDE